MDWVVYVGEKAAENFHIGFQHGVWGHKIIFNGVHAKKIHPGDALYFVQHLQKLKGAIGNNERNGFPRVPVEQLFGVIKSLTKCEVTSHYYESDNQIWPDDTYPHRYNFKIIEQHPNVNFGLEFFSRSFVNSVRDSLLKKGSPIEFMSSGQEKIFNKAEPFDIEIEEGGVIYKTHLRRERNAEIVKKKKTHVLNTYEALKCEVCDFDFSETYGTRGYGFIECHHKNPLADTKVGQKTNLEDLALLCSNCHRMIHRARPWITIEKLRKLICEKGKAG